MSKQILTVCVVSCILLTLAARPHAATRLTDDFNDLAKNADEIVEAEVISRSVFERDEIPWTVATLQIAKSYKGRVAENTSIAVEYPGGSDGTATVVAPGQPHLNTGAKVLALLVRRGAGWRVLSGDYGQANLFQGSDGVEHAVRSTGTFTYYIPDKGSLSGYQSVTQTEISTEKLRELLAAIITTGRPVIERVVAIPEHRVVTQQTVATSSAPSGAYSILVVSLALIGFALHRHTQARA